MSEIGGISEADIKITSPIQERKVPEGNILGNLNKLFYLLGMVTHKSTIRGSEELRSERPISERATRAQLYNQFRLTSQSDRVERKVILGEAHARDEIAKQYLNQGEVQINIPGLGEQAARYVKIEPPQSRRTAETDQRLPIFLIPGISNDIDCVGALTQEIAYMGRKVVVVAMPESIMGKVTPEFARSASESSSFTPHTEFFKGAINALMGGDSKFELWGHSTGTAIIAEILNDPKYQERVLDAVFLNPAASSNITKNALNIGVVNELRNLLSRNLPKYTLSNRSDMGQKELKAGITETMLKKVCTLSQAWKSARVSGGKIVVYSGEKDNLTRSYELFKGDQSSQERLKQINPQVEVIDDPNGFHSTVLITPQPVISQVFKIQVA